ncbi:MAG: sulfur carrier protein ThiS [Candidatus Baltobacteraceae bacterium]
MNVTINGEPQNVAEGNTVAQLLSAVQAPERGIAVAINGQVVRRSDFQDRLIGEGDRIEIITAVAGG